MGNLEQESQHGDAGFNAGPQFAERLADFHSSLAFRLTLLEDASRNLNAYLARDFNIFEYMAPDENTLSGILAELLTPDGKHGQGGIFLSLFLKMIGHPELPTDAASVRIGGQTVVCVPEGGLIDITIDWPDFGLAIENKPWAAEQKDQLHRYWRHLAKTHPDRFCLVYLDGRGKPPESIAKADRDELENRQQFKMVSYVPDLQKWLTDCAKESQADKLRWFLRDLAEYVGQIQELPGGDRQ